MVEVSKGQHFARHPAAAETLRQAISSLLQRYGARPDAKFEERDLSGGIRLVPGTDPAVIGSGLEILLTFGAVEDMMLKTLDKMIGGQEQKHPEARLLVTALDAVKKSIAEQEQKDGDQEKRPRRQLRRSDSER
jgi:hypothetical protein